MAQIVSNRKYVKSISDLGTAAPGTSDRLQEELRKQVETLDNI